MRLEDAFSRIVALERTLPSSVEWQSIDMWPLIRQSVWLELLSPADTMQAPQPSTGVGRGALRGMARLLRKWRYARNLRPGGESVAFISRPVYLQRLPTGEMFDRIVDPLVFAAGDGGAIAKYYVASLPERETMFYPARCLKRATWVEPPAMSEQVRAYLDRIADEAGLGGVHLRERYAEAFAAFVGWYQAACDFLAGRPHLRAIYITSWYFPDMMAITAAARARGITVVEVQHGKQGRFQAMYSGWTRIPDEGYRLMPDRFWCWGQASCEHILTASPARKVHRPFVGGFPWIDYYRQYISRVSVEHDPGAPAQRRILVTTQPVQGDNTEPIPDFLLDYMRADSTGLNLFVFRCHPNDRGGPEYCRRRLASLPAHLYSIDDGKENLYDRLLQSTHHITAYSSCCYEADAFGVPTLLFGQDARMIYSEEIDTGVFAWTHGSATELAGWLESASRRDAETPHSRPAPYIVSSLSHAARILAGDAVEGETHCSQSG